MEYIFAGIIIGISFIIMVVTEKYYTKKEIEK